MYTVHQKDRNTCVVQIKYDRQLEQKFLLTADRHWDNPRSDHAMQRKHLVEAKHCGAGVIDVGDFFCAMQGKWDKRSNKRDIRPEHQTDNYLDALVDTAGAFFKPFSKQFILIGEGNHETSILKKHETNLIDRLVDKIGGKVYNGGYSGWVIFKFEDTSSGECHTVKLWYIHGYGGGGAVTRGVIQSNRKAVYLPDAHLVVSGHTHDEWVVPIARTRVSDEGHRYIDEQVHVQVPSYKDDYDDGYRGWHVETGKPPKPTGAMWLRFEREDRKSPITFDLLRAR